MSKEVGGKQIAPQVRGGDLSTVRYPRRVGCTEARVDPRVGVGDEYRSIGEPMTGERRKERINTSREVLRLDSHSPNRGSREEEPPSFRGPPFFGAMSRKGGVSCCVRPREGAG